MKAKELKKAIGSANYKELQNICKTNDQFKGIKYVAVKGEDLKNNMLAVLNGKTTKAPVKEAPKKEAKESKGKKAKKEAKESKEAPAKLSKATKKLIKKINKAENKKALKVLISDQEALNSVKSKGVKFDQLVDLCMKALQPKTERKSIPKNAPTLTKKELKKYTVSSGGNGVIEQCVINAALNGDPITEKPIIKAMCKAFPEKKKACSKYGELPRSGMAITVQAQLNRIPQNRFQITKVGRGWDATFIATVKK